MRVCGDFDIVERALQGHKVSEWTYLEDLALAKAQDTTEFQWLLRSKGMSEIEKRRKFLLGGEAEANNDEKTELDREEDEEMEGDIAAELQQEDFVGETVAYI